jgi:archaetidylinositol phosphate synthase
MVVRVHQSWSLWIERPVVGWLAARVPAAITPDHMTLLGVVGALVCGLAYVASWGSPAFLWLASLGVIINWFGDSLDGGLARLRHRERPRYGFFIDHTTDVLSELFIFFGLGASPYMRFDIACLAVISYWLAALFSFIRAVATQIFQISYWGIGPTEIRLGLIGYNFYLLAFGRSAFATRFGTYTPIDAFVIVIFVAVFASFLSLVIVEGRRLAKEDTPS